jgi:hypothetical protein
MFRVALAVCLAAWSVFGPVVCCCLAATCATRMSGPAAAGDSPAPASAPALCCCCEPSTESLPAASESPADGDRPSCPCKKQQHQLEALAPAAPSSAKPLPGSPTHEVLGPAADPAEGVILFSDATLPEGQTLSPYASGRDILRALHILRC